MPTIAIVDGVKIQLFYNGHGPAHFHAIIGGTEVLIAIRTLEVMRGAMPPGKLRQVIDWARAHQAELDQGAGQRGPGESLTMPPMLENTIISATADAGAHTVALTWANGAKTVNSFAHLVGKGVFRAFADPAVFARVRVGDNGRSLEWPGELDFCADALWFEAHPEEVPEQGKAAAE
jgi:hypothetical protein